MYQFRTPHPEQSRDNWVVLLPEAGGSLSLTLVPWPAVNAPRYLARGETITAEMEVPTGQPNQALRVRVDYRAQALSRMQRQLHRTLNSRDSELAIGGMLLLLAVCGFIVGGADGARRAMLHCSLPPDHLAMTPSTVARRFGAKLLKPSDMPRLFARLSEICRRARLPRLPDLYYLPAPNSMNAYALGGSHHAAIVLTDGLLQRMSEDEVAGILAHEVAHIANNDRSAMDWATSLQRAVAVTALAGLVARHRRSPADVALGAFLNVAPVISQLLFLSLSRSRELDADARALELIDCPEALVTALGKLEQFHSPFPGPSLQVVEDRVARLLRSHPATSERVGLLVHMAS